MRLLVMLGALFFVAIGHSFAAEVDARFHIHVYQQEGPALTVKDAMMQALPTLWTRVVPVESLSKARRLKGRTSLVLQFKTVKNGINLVFNPVQVRSYLRGAGIQMISEMPTWKLNIKVVGFSDLDERTALDLMSYSYDMANKFGFELSPRGRKLELIFAPVVDEYGQALLHVDVQGSFSSDFIKETTRPAKGYLSYQLQAWLKQILLEIRDIYSLGKIEFKDAQSELLVTVESDYTLAFQVSLEQALQRQPSVVAVVPVLLQKSRRLYRVILKDNDDSWMESWFAGYGLTAVKQPEGSVSQWLVE